MCTEHLAIGGRRVIGASCTIASGPRSAPPCLIAADSGPDGICRGNPARRSTINVDSFRKLNK